MPYSNTVNLISMEGGAWPPVTVRLWMMWNVLGSGTGSGPMQSDEGSDAVTSAASFSFSFVKDADFSYASRDVGLTLQDTPRVADDSGWWFRSGRLPGALPATPLEVVLLSPLLLDRTTDFPAALPPLPITMPSGRVITFFSVITGSSLMVATIAGTTTEGAVPVAFTCRQDITLTPSADPHATGELFTLGFPGSAMLSYAPLTPGDAAGTAAAAVLNATSGLQVGGYAGFLRHTLLPPFVRALEARYVTKALNSLVGLTGPGATTLPAGVIASVRTLVVTPDGLTVRGALGAFGGVISALPPRPTSTPTPGRCFIAAAATSPDSPEVAALRALRDRYLLRSRAGAGFVRLYETLSPPLAEQVQRHRALRLAARHLLVKPASRLAKISLFFGGGGGKY